MEKKSVIIAVLVTVLFLFLAACAPAARPAPAPQAPAPAPAVAPSPAKPAVPTATARPAWEQEWERTLAAARQEGKVSLVLGGVSGTVRSALAEGFKKAYGISMESVSAKGAEISNRVIAERRAGIHSYDACMIGNPQLTLLKPIGALVSLDSAFLLPELIEPELIKKTWWGGKLWWLDNEHTVFISALRTSLSIAINTNLVKEGEVKSYRDLLNPKWKGKIVLADPTTGGAGANFLLFVDTMMGWDYLSQLAETVQPAVLKDERLQLDWLSHGKVAVVVVPDQTTLYELIKAGAPVKGLIPAEGTWLGGSSGMLSLFDKAPHPNAVKVFINWLLSKEGQSVFVVPMGAQSLRLDVPVDHLPAEQRWQEGMKYFVPDEKAVLAGPALQKKAGELLRPLMGK